MANKTTFHQYKQALAKEGLKKQTIANYLWHTNKFLNWLGADKLNPAKIQDYQSKLLQSRYSSATINLHLASVNKYLSYLGQNPALARTRLEKKSLLSLTPRQLNKLLEAVPDTSRLVDCRDRALLEILYTTGLKVGQIVTLKRKYIDQIKQEIIIDSQNHISIPPLAWSHLKKYLTKRTDEIDYLFVNLDRANKGKELSLSIRSVERIITKYGQKVGLTVSPQILRNTLAQNLKEQGATGSELKQSLRFQTKLGAENYLKRL